ncbi:MAG: tyrosine-type recombinase/integrase [Xanthomonadales bacterium]|nr:tyrosine-type recombinase/integrase [Xanthomonadales bacterium]ODU91683.1 MAG: integrase [Rhodanobacter sp. SCN 66-43]OJY85044.1 MAG: integrase [Xanthomonadales bacterium 66-474]
MLTDKAVKAMKPGARLYRRADAKGLCIEVQPTGARYWRYRYRFGGKAKMFSLGVYPEVSLAEARERCDEARRALRSGIDPGAKRKQDKLIAKVLTVTSFEPVAREWLAGRGKLADTTRAKTLWALTSHAFPWIGKRPIGEITAPELLAVLRRLESRGKLETAQRLKQICGQVFRYAVATGRAERDPSADLRGVLKTKKTRHFGAITDPAKVGPLLRAIDGFPGSLIVACALKLAPMVFVRPGELRKAEWAEFDLDRAEWRIPAERMKMRQMHFVPLATQAVAVLRDLQPVTGRGTFVFPGIVNWRHPMSENTINAALRRLGYTGDEMTGHGFRSMASTLLNEQGWPPDVIERQLAHAESNKVRAAYNHAEYLAERRKMMQAWADHLDVLKRGATVVPIRKASGAGL